MVEFRSLHSDASGRELDLDLCTPYREYELRGVDWKLEWTLDWTTGLDYWITGLDYWIVVLQCACARRWSLLVL